MDRATSDVIAVLERFCAAFADRDADALMRLVGARGRSRRDHLGGVAAPRPAKFEAFLRRYEEGPTTYSWDWDRYDVSIAGPTA
jgi:hypothetical protein